MSIKHQDITVKTISPDTIKPISLAPLPDGFDLRAAQAALVADICSTFMFTVAPKKAGGESEPCK